MFLTREEWCHPNRFVQALATPAVAWHSISVSALKTSLLAEIKDFENAEWVGSEWLMLSQFDLLIDQLAVQRVGAVHVLVPPHFHVWESWQMQQVVALRKWRSGTLTGLECQAEDGAWYSSMERPCEASVESFWLLRNSDSNCQWSLEA
ncbi:hypothetical protein D9M69_220540 [compost metagenome]